MPPDLASVLFPQSPPVAKGARLIRRPGGQLGAQPGMSYEEHIKREREYEQKRKARGRNWRRV